MSFLTEIFLKKLDIRIPFLILFYRSVLYNSQVFLLYILVGGKVNASIELAFLLLVIKTCFYRPFASSNPHLLSCMLAPSYSIIKVRTIC